MCTLPQWKKREILISSYERKGLCGKNYKSKKENGEEKIEGESQPIIFLNPYLLTLIMNSENKLEPLAKGIIMKPGYQYLGQTRVWNYFKNH